MGSILDKFVNWFKINQDLISIFEFLIGGFSCFFGVITWYFALVAAKGSDKLIKRLVVYPFRELDKKMATLPEYQRENLFILYNHTGGKSCFSLEDAKDLLGQFSDINIQFLLKEGWLKFYPRKNKYRIHPDRYPYIIFYLESESKIGKTNANPD